MNIIIYDGPCGLCNRFVAFVIRRDGLGVYRFTSQQSDVGKALFDRYGLGGGDEETVILLEGDEVYIKSEAVIRILRGLGGAWRVAGLLSYVPVMFRDYLYDCVVRVRYKFFGYNSYCAMDKLDRTRFLD